MVAGRFYTINWLLGGRDRPSISRGSAKHDMADHACELCVVQHPSFATVRGERTVRWHESIAVLPVRLCGILCMV